MENPRGRQFIQVVITLTIQATSWLRTRQERSAEGAYPQLDGEHLSKNMGIRLPFTLCINGSPVPTQWMR